MCKITIFPGKALEIQVPKVVTPELLDLYRQIWPLPVTQEEVGIRFTVQWDAERESCLVHYSDTSTTTLRCTLPSGYLLDEFTWQWLHDGSKEEDRLEVLRELAGISGYTEQHSFMEFGGSCYTLFEVDEAWREVGFVVPEKDENLATKWLLLQTWNSGFEDVSEYTQENYDELMQWIEEESEEYDNK